MPKTGFSEYLRLSPSDTAGGNIYTIFETAKACVVDPRDYLRQVVLADVRNPGTVTMPEPIQELLEELAD